MRYCYLYMIGRMFSVLEIQLIGRSFQILKVVAFSVEVICFQTFKADIIEFIPLICGWKYIHLCLFYLPLDVTNTSLIYWIIYMRGKDFVVLAQISGETTFYLIECFFTIFDFQKIWEKMWGKNKNWYKVNKLFLYHISDSFNLFNSFNNNNNLET